jgi:hypothetical protein
LASPAAALSTVSETTGARTGAEQIRVSIGLLTGRRCAVALRRVWTAAA